MAILNARVPGELSLIHSFLVKSTPSLASLTHPAAESAAPRRMPAWAVPLAILSGFALLFLGLFRDRLLPAPTVEVARVLTTTPAAGEATPSVSSTAGAMLFQASGWIEPDPLPIKATALIDGVIDQVHVLEGRKVAKGEALVSFIEDDARLALAAAEEKHRMLAAAKETHVAAIVSSRRKLEATEATVKAALTLEEEAIDQHRRLSGMRKGSIPEADVVSARLRVDREKMQRISAEAESAAAAAEITRMELETQVREAEARAAGVEVDQAKLALSRTRVLSPVDGRVLRLLAAPGQKKHRNSDDPESATVAILYQPDKLQVRVDVPLADAAKLREGQSVILRCGLLPDRAFQGKVTRITGEADIQRNTLQVKVAILDPSDQLRPEMLCRAEFLGGGGNTEPAAGSLALWIPQASLTDQGVWTCDPESRRVAKRAVRPTAETKDSHIRIAEGLRPGELVILSPKNLRDGQRVHPILQQP